MVKKDSSSFDMDKNGVKYRHPERTCKNCSKYPCFRGQKEMKCDYAKYGCKSYKED